MKNLNNHSFCLIPKELISTIPTINKAKENPNLNEAIIYAHIFGVIGDWFISGLSEDGKIAFGYQHVEAEEEWEMTSWFTNAKEWGEFSIDNMQNLVNNEFLKEKDIRFLIVRDISWQPKKFADVVINQATLNYPGSVI